MDRSLRRTLGVARHIQSRCDTRFFVELEVEKLYSDLSWAWYSFGYRVQLFVDYSPARESTLAGPLFYCLEGWRAGDNRTTQMSCDYKKE